MGRVDPSGLKPPQQGNAPSSRRLFGIAPDQQDAAFREDRSGLAQAKMAVKMAAYGILNALTGGFVAKHDESFEAWQAGEISGLEYTERSGLDAGFSVVTTVGGGAVGGRVGGYVASKGGSAIVAGAIGGAVEGGATNVVEQGIAIGTDRQEGFELEQLALSGAVGGGFGAAGGHSATKQDAPGPQAPEVEYRPTGNPQGDSTAGGEFIDAQPNLSGEPVPPLAPQEGRGTETLYRAPRAGGQAERQLAEGLDSRDFTIGDQCCYVSRDPAVAETFAEYGPYDGRVLEVKVGGDFFDAKLAGHERGLHLGDLGDTAEIPIPADLLDDVNLNTVDRSLR